MDFLDKKLGRTEEQVFIDLNRLGFEIFVNDNDYFQIEHEYSERIIIICKASKRIRCYKHFLNSCQTTINNTKMPAQSFDVKVACSLSIVELKVLYELFEIWGWI